MPAFAFLFAFALLSPETLIEQLRRDGAQDLRVHRVQLDADPSLEVVLQCIIPGQGVIGRVLDHDNGVWRMIGKFNSWWRFEPADAGRFLEFRETVATGVKDIIVRYRGGGTEVSGTTVEIHRLRDGNLVNVLSVNEETTAMEHPSGNVFVTSAEITYALGRITTVTMRRPGNRRTCASYAWNEARFHFEEENGACP